MTDRCLITGAQGFIGRYLIVHLLEGFPAATLLGIGRAPEETSTFRHSITSGGRAVRAPLPEELRNLDVRRYSYVSCELSTPKSVEVLRGFCPTAVIHLAASLRSGSEEDAFQNNVRSTEGLLRAIRASGVKIRHLLLVSSGGVYGNQETLPIGETAPVRPVDLYSHSKLSSENLALSFASESGIPTTIARVFNVFGPGQDELHFAGRMAGQIAAILAGTSAPILRVGPISTTRDFLDVRDVCSAIRALLERNVEGICNIGSGVETIVGDLLQLLIQAAGLKTAVEIQQETDRSDPIPRHFANVNRLAQTFFAPRYSLTKTCHEMLECYTRLVHNAIPA
jgi:nucleoside-diphosphate-sugar epimerase